MTERIVLSTEILLHIAQALEIPMHGLVAVIELLEDGGTVPFIARYRKEATGNLDEVKIRDIDEKRQHYKELDERRDTILASIEKQGLLTDDLRQKIRGVYTKADLEDIYLPFKPKRKSKAKL